MTDLGMKNALSKEGWNLSDEGYAICSTACLDGAASPAPLHEIALNQDLRKIGSQCLPSSISRGVAQEVKGPLILQIQKVTNIAVPSYHQQDGSGGGIRLLKLQLTDGHTYCNALELKHTPQLNLSMPPGTKLKITSDVMARNGFLLLTPAVVKVLGGHVDHMVEKWKASKVIVTERSKITSNAGDGPPAFVPFGKVTSKRQDSAKPTEQAKSVNTSATMHPQKYSSQPKQDVKMSSKHTDKPKGYQHHPDTGEATSHRHTANKPHQHHQTKHSHQHDRFQDRPFRGQSSKQRTHNPQYRSKGRADDRSQGQSLSDFLPITFNSSEEHFPALSRPTNHPQACFTTTNDKQHPPPHKPSLAWDSHTPNTTTGGSVPFSAKPKM